MTYNPPYLPQRSPSGHKGTFGTLLIIGGHQAKTDVVFGGAALAGLGALRTGIGQCIFGMSEEVLHDAITIVPQATGFSLSKSNLNELDDVVRQKADCVLIGPALGAGELQKEVLKHILQCNKPLVIDADGLNIIAQNPDLYNLQRAIITPHPVEFDRLRKAFGIINEDTDAAADALAQKMESVVVLKNSRTYITDGSMRYAVDKPNPVLASAGSGDVLSGIIAGLVTQFYPNQLSLFDAAVLGVIIHSKAGKLWKQEHGDRGILITELIELIPKAQKSL